jgi:hypothetical protein
VENRIGLATRLFVLPLGVTIEGLKPGNIEAALWRQLEARGMACLWIVDDVPSGITASDLQRCVAKREHSENVLRFLRKKIYVVSVLI